MKTVYVTVKVVVQDDTDVDELVSEVDYEFNDPAIVSTEIIDYTEY